MSNYSCSQCGLAIAKVEDRFIKACFCEATISANMSAEAHGIGGVKQE